MNTLGIIPARAGSKGVPNKNKLIINGKPLIFYTIEAALKSKKLKNVILTTDDNEIIELCSNFNILIRKRPKNLAKDDSPISGAIIDVIDYYSKIINDEKIESIMLLQPTSPLRSSIDIDDSINSFYENSNYNSLISVCEMDDIHPGRMYWIDSENTMVNILPEFENTRRQDNKLAYFRNGCIYLTKINSFLKTSSLINRPILPYKMNSNFLLNIDSDRDLIIASSVMKEWINNQ
jgi:CMP-N,N'-diacetyllegionaminic acid synthase